MRVAFKVKSVLTYLVGRLASKWKRTLVFKIDPKKVCLPLRQRSVNRYF